MTLARRILVYIIKRGKFGKGLPFMSDRGVTSNFLLIKGKHVSGARIIIGTLELVVAFKEKEKKDIPPTRKKIPPIEGVCQLIPLFKERNAQRWKEDI